MQFFYRARNARGEEEHGTYRADGPGQVVEALLEQGYFILELTPARPSPIRERLQSLIGPGIKNRDLALFTRQFATLQKGGVPLLQTLHTLREQAPNQQFKGLLSALYRQVQKGESLAAAMAQYPGFPRIYTGLVQVGEAAGKLDEILLKLALNLEKEEEISRKIKNACTYPVVLLVVTLGVVVFLTSVVLPSFVGQYQSAGVELPGMTRLLLQAGIFMQKKGIYLLPFAAAAGILLLYHARREGRSLFWDRQILRLPLLGPIMSRISAARFARGMWVLLDAGVPVYQALILMEGVAGNRVMGRAISHSREMMNEGEPIAVPLQKSRIFEPIFTHMLAVGEDSGSLEQMFSLMAEYYEREVLYALERLLVLLEPVLILLVALVVGGVVLATLLPLLEFLNIYGIVSN